MIGGAAQVCMDYPVFATLVLFISGLIFLLVWRKTKREGETFSPTNLVSHLSKEDLLSEIKKLKDDLFDAITQRQTCEAKEGPQSSGTSRVYTTDTTRFYQVGYIESGSQYFPLFGRRLYRQRSDKWEYYIIEGSENKVRIPIKTANDNELIDGEAITIGELRGIVRIYEYKTVRYNPDV